MKLLIEAKRVFLQIAFDENFLLSSWVAFGL